MWRFCPGQNQPLTHQNILKKAQYPQLRMDLSVGILENAGLPNLRQEIVKKTQKGDNNIDANISQILVTVGAIEGLAAAVMAVIDPGDEVIMPPQHIQLTSVKFLLLLVNLSLFL